MKAQDRPQAQTEPVRRYFGGFSLAPTIKDTQRYMRGECAYMALALQSLLPGSQLWELGGAHLAVEDATGDFWDVRGRMTLAQAWNGIAGTCMEPLTREAVIAQVDSGIYRCGLYTPKKERAARSFLRGRLPQPEPKRVAKPPKP